jgi:precorrin-4/cobalt-precorrin-4 C11-methyltransferase
MTVHFIGAGPGAPDLITVRALNLIKACPVVLYAGSLVPEGVIEQADPDATVTDTAPLHLDEIIELMCEAHGRGQNVARVHSGDPSLYGAIAEQIRRLDDHGIDYDVTPGVPAFAAAAAALQTELTLPDVSQTVILTRTAVRATAMPEGEDLTTLGKSGATLAIHLSVNNLARVVRELVPYRVSWPDQAFISGTLSDIRPKVKAAGFTRTALILVGEVLGNASFRDSRLYDEAHHHVLRPRKVAGA